jgi:hypothetical protein
MTLAKQKTRIGYVPSRPSQFKHQGQSTLRLKSVEANRQAWKLLGESQRRLTVTQRVELIEVTAESHLLSWTPGESDSEAVEE